MIDLRQGDCLEVMRDMADASVTAIVTDPPYALEFMGKGWDKVLPSDEVWREALRVLKPGGVTLVFGGTRTFHRLTCSLEDAGFQIRDVLCWLYGSGFPKSLDVSKAIDKAAGAEHLRTFKEKNPADRPYTHIKGETSTGWQSPPRPDKTNPATDAAKLWDGYGTALKPAWEPIVLAMKPLDGTFAANALEHGVAGINVDECRIDERDRTDYGLSRSTRSQGNTYGDTEGTPANFDASKGRWPANVVHDGSDEVEVEMPTTTTNAGTVRKHNAGMGYHGGAGSERDIQSSKGSASRFFYCAKASKKDRGPDNRHPTVKPTALMRWLVRMVKMPSDTVVFDPFAGSGSTGVACVLEGVDFIGVEREAEYVEIARRRIDGV